MSDERESFDKPWEVRFAPDDQIAEWEEEVERWLPEAVGYSVRDALLTDGANLTDFMDMEPTGEHTQSGHQIVWVTPARWGRARGALLRYGVDIGPREKSLHSDTNLVSLAKRTLGHQEAFDGTEDSE